MTPGSSDHVREWIEDYRQRMQAAINQRRKPEGIEAGLEDIPSITLACDIPQ